MTCPQGTFKAKPLFVIHSAPIGGLRGMDISPQWPVIKDVVLFFIAVYGAALSTFNWRQAVKKDRRQVSVGASTAMPTYGATVGPPFAKIEAVNTGHRSVTVKTITFELSTGGRLAPMASSGFPGLPDTPLPAALSDGQTASTMMSYADIGTALISSGKTGKTKLTPICIDTTDIVHKGEPWDVDPQEFVQMGE